jgi:hypothetical protein
MIDRNTSFFFTVEWIFSKFCPAAPAAISSTGRPIFGRKRSAKKDHEIVEQSCREGVQGMCV